MSFTYSLDDGIATIRFDDGKANAIDGNFLEGLNGSLDRAERDAANAVILTGREGLFCAGLNLKRLPSLPARELQVTLELFTDVMLRVFLFPRPVVAAVNGHAIAGGGVLMLAADARIAADGPYKLGLNEVAIGITLPSFVVDIGIATLPPRHHAETLLHGRLYSPAEALQVGYVDRVVATTGLEAAAREAAKGLAALPSKSYAATKERLRGRLIAASRAGAKAEMASFVESVAGGSLRPR